jgi:hypothetical protein
MTKPTLEASATRAMRVALAYMGKAGNIECVPGYQVNRLIDALIAYRDGKLAQLQAYYGGQQQ